MLYGLKINLCYDLSEFPNITLQLDLIWWLCAGIIRKYKLSNSWVFKSNKAVIQEHCEGKYLQKSIIEEIFVSYCACSKL